MVKKCEQCGLEYDAKRSTSRFCSDKCKVSFNRNKVTVTNVTVNPDTVTLSDVTLTHHVDTYTGGSDCGCGMCKNKVVNNSSKIINHGPWKSASELKENEINRVPIPGDVDYEGCMKFEGGAWC